MGSFGSSLWVFVSIINACSSLNCWSVYYLVDCIKVAGMRRGAATYSLSVCKLKRRTPMSETSQRVLFLCTHNSSRSQMAEGLLRAHGGPAFQVFSAGTQPRTVHPLAIQAMQEIGIDISHHTAKGIDVFAAEPPLDLVITVCDEAAEACPFFPNARRQVHWGFPDPSQAQGSEEERLAVFRRIRDQIAAKIDQFLSLQPSLSLEEVYAAARAVE